MAQGTVTVVPTANGASYLRGRTSGEGTDIVMDFKASMELGTSASALQGEGQSPPASDVNGHGPIRTWVIVLVLVVMLVLLLTISLFLTRRYGKCCVRTPKA